MSLHQLEEDLDEVKILLKQAKRQRVKDVLYVVERKLETEILALKESEQCNSKRSDVMNKKTATKSLAANKRYIAELHEYAWDQNDKFVKIFVTLNGVQSLPQLDINTLFTENSVHLSVKNLNDKDYCLIINNLLSSIDTGKCYQKIKADMVVIYMKKKNESFHWSHLTVTEKRLKEIKDNQFKVDDNDDLKDDPTAGIMNLMKKMYESGDSEMKRMIAKAWTESQEKSKDKVVDM